LDEAARSLKEFTHFVQMVRAYAPSTKGYRCDPKLGHVKNCKKMTSTAFLLNTQYLKG